MIFALILLACLALSVFINLAQFVSRFVPGTPMIARSSGPRLEETVLKDNSASGKIAVVDLDGLITSRTSDRGGYTMVDLFKAQLERAGEDRKVKAVVLRVDSPGGEVLAADELYRALAQFQTNFGKPVISSMGNLAASGGYYVAAASRWIVANELTITGSIGVILHSWNYRGLMDKVGLRPEVYKSGKYKDMLSGERNPDDIPAEERAMVQALIDQTYSRFQDVVAQGRGDAHAKNREQGKALAGDWKTYADGRVLSGTQAYEIGFVDELGDFDDAVDRACKFAGIMNANLVQYRTRYDLFDIFRLFGRSEAPVVKLDVGVETPKLEAGRLYFLSPTYLH
jgi:protease-4